MKYLIIGLIKVYQFLRPTLDAFTHGMFGFHFECRHPVSCSQYTLQQVKEHGTIAGLFFGIKRILTCWG